MTDLEFNFHAKRARYNTRSLEVLYDYCTNIIKNHLKYKFGDKHSFLSTVPHDVFTKIIIENPPTKFIASPSAYLCTAASNYVISLYKLKDNCTLELREDYAYSPDFEEALEFNSKEIKSVWDGLDEQSRYIIFQNVYVGFQLKEVAAIMGLEPGYVRTKKSRALKLLKAVAKK